MKKNLFSIVLISGFSVATAYGAADAARDQKAQADVKSALSTIRSSSDSRSVHHEPAFLQSAVAQVEDEAVAKARPQKAGLARFSHAVREAVPTMLPELCAIMCDYCKPPIIFKNLLPENTSLNGDDVIRHKLMKIHLFGGVKTLRPGQEVDWASELKSGQLVPAACGSYEPYQEVFISYPEGGWIHSKTHRKSERELWAGIGFCVRENTHGVAIVEEFDPAKGPALQVEPERVKKPADKPVRLQLPVPAQAKRSFRKLNFSA